MRFSDISIRTKMFVFVLMVLIMNSITLVIFSLIDGTHKYDTAFIQISDRNKDLARKVIDYSDVAISNDLIIRNKAVNRLNHVINQAVYNLLILKKGGSANINGMNMTIEPVSSDIQKKINHLQNDLKSLKFSLNQIVNSTYIGINTKKEFIKKVWSNDLMIHSQEMIAMHIHENESKELSYKSILIGFFLLNFIAILGVFRLVSLYIVKPIRKLSKDYKELANNSEEKHFILNRKDEIGELAKNLDEVFTQLYHSKKEAEEAKKTQSMFLANMSHEIRTPMNSIVGFTNLLVKTPLNTKQNQFMHNIQTNAKNLLVIINDILDFSKAEANKIQLEQVVFSIEDIVNQVVTACEEKAQKNNTQIIFNIDAEIPNWVIGDPTRLYQITLNLVSNAVKFTHNGKVTISLMYESCQNGSTKIRFAVRDTGIGIAKHEIPKLFESFTQASSNITRKFGGTGLGLSIVKHLVSLHGGTIEVDSELGQGSVFYFTVSYPIADEPQQLLHSLEDIPESMMNELKNYQFNILLVEDIIFNRAVAIETMYEWGLNLHIIEAENGVEALKKLEENEIDIILMDIQMPEMDGYTATKKIREDLTGNKALVPIIAMSAHASETEVQLSREAGMNDYLTKPFQPEDFLKKMVSYFQVISKHKPRFEYTSVSEQSNVHQGEDIKNVDFKLVDVQFIRDFAKGKVERIEKMVKMFLEQTPQEINKLHQLYQDQNYEGISSLVHAIKSKFTYMGLSQLSDLAFEIEINSKNLNNLDQVKRLIDELDAYCQQAYKELESLIDIKSIY